MEEKQQGERFHRLNKIKHLRSHRFGTVIAILLGMEGMNMTLNEADAKYRDLGAVSKYDDGVVNRMYRGGREGYVNEFTHLFRHYFNAEDQEIGYVTIPLMTIEGYQSQVFDIPRIWGWSIKRETLGNVAVHP